MSICEIIIITIFYYSTDTLEEDIQSIIKKGSQNQNWDSLFGPEDSPQSPDSV